MTPGASHAYDGDVLAKHLDALRHRPIDPAEKGFAAYGPTTPDALVRNEVSVPGGGLTLPLMVLRESALASNVATMAAWCRERGVELAPHGKTSMSPEVTARQLAAGAWGVTAATIGQVRAYAEVGVRRILLANQLVDPAGIGWLATAMSSEPALTVVGYVDSVEGVALLDRELRIGGATRAVPVLVELGVPGRRTGTRTVEAGVEVARAAAATTTLDVVGVAGFEGVLGHGRAPDALDAVARFCRDLRALGLRLLDGGLLEGSRPILSAGGSTYFDVVARELVGDPAQVVLRSGGYVTHDDGLYAHATPLPAGGAPYALQAALDVWAYVLSRPEPGRVLVGAGRRDVPFDVDLPVVRRAVSPAGTRRVVDGVTVSRLNDQHAFLDVPDDSDLAVGDTVVFGISHPCTAFDKWRLVPVVDDAGRIVEVAHTLF